jgi:hypothetical protein
MYMQVGAFGELHQKRAQRQRPLVGIAEKDARRTGF